MNSAWKLLLVAVWMMVGCTTEPDCSEEIACGFGSVCVEGVCEERLCATSAQCSMEAYCDNGVCLDGCSDDTDCFPGDGCDLETNTCEPVGCTDTHADCGFKEFCNSATGDCYDAGGTYCADCNDDNDCAGEDNYCTGYGYCGVSCTSEDDCPSGFMCAGFYDANGNVQYYQCFTYCWLYEDYDPDGWDSTGDEPLDYTPVDLWPIDPGMLE